MDIYFENSDAASMKMNNQTDWVVNHLHAQSADNLNISPMTLPNTHPDPSCKASNCGIHSDDSDANSAVVGEIHARICFPV